MKKDTERILLNPVDLKMIKHSFNEEVKMSQRESGAFHHRENLNSSQGLITKEVAAGSGKVSDAALTQYAFKNT